MLNLTPIEARHDARETNTETDADVSALIQEVYRLRRSLALAAACVRLGASQREHDPVLLGLAEAIEEDGYGDRNPTRRD